MKAHIKTTALARIAAVTPQRVWRVEESGWFGGGTSGKGRCEE